MVPGRERLHVPSILTMVLGGFVAGIAALGLIVTLFPEVMELLRRMLGGTVEATPLRLLMGWLVLTGGFVLYGGWQLRVGRSMGLAVVTCIALALPCSTSSCFVVGFPLALWIFIVLTDAKVQRTFGMPLSDG